MRQIWKVLRIFWAMLTRTAYLSWHVKRFPKNKWGEVRADRQMAGCRLLCRILGIEVNMIGPRPEGGGRLIVSNHFGVLDPVVLASVLPVSFVAKSEMKKWPFVGWVANSFGVLFVDRERRTTVPQFTEQVQTRVAQNVDVLVFPEGTTSPDLTVLPFKTGVFEAVSGRPNQSVVPVYLSVEEVNSQPALGDVRKRVVWSDPDLPFLKHCWEVAGLRRIKMEVRVGRPIAVGQLDRKELAQVSKVAVEDLRDHQPAERLPADKWM